MDTVGTPIYPVAIGGVFRLVMFDVDDREVTDLGCMSWHEAETQAIDLRRNEMFTLWEDNAGCFVAAVDPEIVDAEELAEMVAMIHYAERLGWRRADC